LAQRLLENVHIQTVTVLSYREQLESAVRAVRIDSLAAFS
jgi:hypothetical protein